VSAALLVSRHGKHRQHVKRDVPQGQGSRTQWVRVGPGAADLGSRMAAVDRTIPLRIVVNGTDS
jgi:hypothetical protein